MDPYLRPILVSTIVVILLNTVFILPIDGTPLLSYFIGGIIAVLFFKKDLKDKFQEIKAFDVVVLGLGTGIVVGAILTLIVTAKMQSADMQKFIIDSINNAMKMHSKSEFHMINQLGPVFYIVIAMVTIGTCSFMSLFGALSTLPFVNKGKK